MRGILLPKVVIFFKKFITDTTCDFLAIIEY